MRITKKDLKRVVEDLNRVTRNKYCLEGAYGGYKLSMQKGEGYVDITDGFVKPGVLYYTIWAIIRVLRYEEEKEKMK
jgi:hypothetical protein